MPTLIPYLMTKGATKTFNKTKEVLLADRYKSSQYTFDQAYKDARSKGQKTFFWNGKYYNTDYEGSHGKQYKADVASGKAQAWQQQYPGFTNPELRKEKQEEIDTYGITNEQTKNKTWRDRLLRKIPARGYEVSDAISSLLGEHHNLSLYNTPEELISSLKKKYPEFKNVPLSGEIIDAFDGSKAVILNPIEENPEWTNKKRWPAFKRELRTWEKINNLGGNHREELHRNEYDYLLGWPISHSHQSAIPMISAYRTGNEPYYYTTKIIEESRPIISEDFLKRRDRTLELDRKIDELISSIQRPNLYKLISEKTKHTSKEEDEAIEKDNLLFPDNVKKQAIVDKYNEDRNKMYDIFRDKYESDSLYRKRWNNIGAGMHRNGVFIEYPILHESKHTSADLDTLERLGAFRHLEQLPLTPGNRIAGTGEKYYSADYDKNDSYYDTKYDKLVSILRKLNKNSEDHNAYDSSALNTSEFIYSMPTLGTYTYSVPKDSSYVSIWDVFDIDPFGSGNDKPSIKVGRPFEYYTRFYPEGKEPQIDSLYNTFWKK